MKIEKGNNSGSIGLVRSTVSIDQILFICIDAIDSVNRIDRIDRIDRINSNDCIDPGFLNFSALQLKYNSNDPTNYRMNFLDKKGGNFEVTVIYCHLQIFHEVCLKDKNIPLGVMTSNSPRGKSLILRNRWGSNISLGKKLICHLAYHGSKERNWCISVW